MVGLKPRTFLHFFPPVTSKYHIRHLQRFLVTVFYVENYLVSRPMHCLLLEKIGKLNVFMSSVRMERHFVQVHLLRLSHTDRQLNRCCLQFQLREGINVVPEALYSCLFKRCWMNLRKLSILILVMFFLCLLEGTLFVAGKMCHDSDKNNCRWLKEQCYSA
jgi:hypothetical protein